MVPHYLLLQVMWFLFQKEVMLMDRTQRIEELRKKLFQLRFDLTMAKKDEEKMNEIELEIKEVRKKLKELMIEEATNKNQNIEKEGRKKK